MIRINLLPHRQLKRAERQRQFMLMVAATFVLGAAVVFMGQTYVTAQIDAQMERNNRLETANAKLDKQIAEIQELKNQIQDVLSRKQVVESLQTNRGQAVVLLDELARQLPEGMYLKSVKQQATLVTIEGVADTNARIATLVRNFSTSPWLESPNLVEIKAVTNKAQRQSQFTMTVKLKAQKADKP